MLTSILTYHVVAGKMTAKSDLMMAIKAGQWHRDPDHGAGRTADGVDDGQWSPVMLTDAKGGMSMVTIADVMQSNGVVHVVDTVLMP